MHDNSVWTVTMRGRLGYTCVAQVSCANAKNENEALIILSLMFPELTMVCATKDRLLDVSG